MVLINLFSVFDPSSFFGFHINWVVILFVLSFFIIKFYIIRRSSQLVKGGIFDKINFIFVEISGSANLALVFVVVRTFIYLVISNLLGLFPFIFTSTAHPLITIRIGVIFWSSFFFIGWVKNFKERAAHLVPEGSPLGLAPFIVLIESIRHLIRPFTLSIRLAANMMAGHLIISLLSRIRIINLVRFRVSVFFQRILLILELGVAVIQGFVFRILLLLYCLEYY